MLLTLTTTHVPATDLGYLLHKNPAKVQTFELSFGKAHVFYPEATADRCAAACCSTWTPWGSSEDARARPVTASPWSSTSATGHTPPPRSSASLEGPAGLEGEESQGRARRAPRGRDHSRPEAHGR